MSFLPPPPQKEDRSYTLLYNASLGDAPGQVRTRDVGVHCRKPPEWEHYEEVYCPTRLTTR